MRTRQGNSFNTIKGSWAVVDYLSSLLKKTELQALVLNFLITNNDAGAAIEATAVLDLIDVKLTRDGNKTMFDCTLGDLLRIGMQKDRTNYGSIGTVALGGGTFNCQVVIPFADKARPQPKDSSLVVDTLKSLQLEIRDNNVATTVLSAIETMQIIDDAKTSLRITSDRMVLSGGITIAAATPKFPYPIHSAHRTLCMLVGTRTNLSYLQVDGADHAIVDGEPDEILTAAMNALALNPPDLAWTSAGANMLNTCLPIPLLENGDGYGGTMHQALNFRMDTTGAVSLRLVQDFVDMPDTKRISEQMKVARPGLQASQARISAIGKNGQRLTNQQAARAGIIPQLKIAETAATNKALNPATADINLEAAIDRL